MPIYIPLHEDDIPFKKVLPFLIKVKLLGRLESNNLTTKHTLSTLVIYKWNNNLHFLAGQCSLFLEDRRDFDISYIFNPENMIEVFDYLYSCITKGRELMDILTDYSNQIKIVNEKTKEKQIAKENKTLAKEKNKKE